MWQLLVFQRNRTSGINCFPGHRRSSLSCRADACCNGGNPINAWGAMNGWGGDEFNKDYPYTSGTTQQDGTCKGIVKTDIATHTQPNSYSMIASAASDESAMAGQIKNRHCHSHSAQQLLHDCLRGIRRISDGGANSKKSNVCVCGRGELVADVHWWIGYQGRQLRHFH